MKKFWMVALVLCLVGISSIALADNGWGDFEQGVGIFTNWSESRFESMVDVTRASGAAYEIVTHAAYAPKQVVDFNQSGTITIQARAKIPCYVELEVFGNRAYAKVKSIGEGAAASETLGIGNLMVFDIEQTGIMDAAWNFIDVDAAAFSTIGPNREGRDPVYIHACDLFKATVYGNVDYNFSVAASPLILGLHELHMEMRYQKQADMVWVPADTSGFGTSEAVAHVIGTYDALESDEVFMQFRVPFAEVPAGIYVGTVYFKVASI